MPAKTRTPKTTKKAKSQDRALLAIIEAAYAVEASEHDWLRGLATEVYESADVDMLGAYAQRYTFSADGRTSFGHLELVGADPATMNALHDELGAYYSSRPDRIAATYGATDEGFALALPGGERAEIASILERRGVGDMYGINARSSSGAGCLLCLYLPPRFRAISDDRRTAFARIARHVSCALRLRTRLDGKSASPEAIIDPLRGRIEHADGEAKTKKAREQLVSAAQTIVRLRRHSRARQPERAVAAWKGLVDARWSLVDWFDEDGSAYVVAHRNDAPFAPIELLTARERQVVALAALGLANKMIGYELGIATSTVGVLLSRAASRLRVSSRRELIARVSAAGTGPR